MEDWSGTVYGPTTHGPTPRRKPSPRTPGPGAATPEARPGPRKKAAATSSEALPEPPAATSAETPTSATSAEAAKSTSSAEAATSTSSDEATAVAHSATALSTPAKRSPRKATTPSAESVDEKLLAHLDVVLADVDLPAPAPPAPALTALPAAQTAASERTALWDQILADPGFAPEHLVRDAVRLIGPQAREWVDRTRERYPQARTDALARLAAEVHVRTARRQAMANTTAVGSWAEVGLLSRTHASLVLTIAAVYGADPTAEARTRDLLELLPIPRLTESSLAAAGNVGRLLGAVAVRRVAARLMPFGAAVAGTIHSGRMTEDVAMRAIDRFRPKAPLRP